jgi:hypothetical protein
MAVLLAAHSESKIAQTTGVDIRNTPPLAPHSVFPLRHDCYIT